MSSPLMEIKYSEKNGGYNLYVSGKFIGCYATAVAAARDYEQTMKRKEENKNEDY